MAQTDNVQAHKVEAPDTKPCEGALGAGIFAAQMDERAGRHTVGTDTYAGRNCKPPETYKSVDDLLAAEKSRLADNKPPITEFALPAQSDPKVMEKMVRDSISGLENEQGSAKLDYLWFNDESGNAQIFVLGKAGKKLESEPPKPSEAASVKTCVDPDSLVDDSANLQNNIPLGTAGGEFERIMGERINQANLAQLGIPIDASETQAQAILNDRLLQAKALEDRLPALANRSDEQNEKLARDLSALDIGLPPGLSSADISKAQHKQELEAHAILLGLGPQASSSAVEALENRIAVTPDLDLNERLGLPVATTRKDALFISMTRRNDAELVEQGVSPDLAPDEISKILAERRSQIAQIRSELTFPEHLSPSEIAAKENAMDAIKIGMPATSSFQDVVDTMTKYHLQSSAVELGLDRFASKAEIDAAKKRLYSKVPDNVCEFKPPEQK